LQKVATQYEGVARGTKQVLTADLYAGRFTGIAADFLDTAVEHEVMLESVLGDRLHYVVGADDELVQEALLFLRGQAAGRCSFITQPLPAVTKIDPPAGTEPLTELVEIQAGFRPFLESLLINVFVADTLHHALTCSRQYPGAVFVTRQGDFAHSGGVITGGSTEAAQSGIMHTKREIRELARAAAALTETVADMTARREIILQQTTQVADEFRQQRQDVHAAELRMVTVEKDLQRARAELSHLEERLSVVELEEQQLAEERTVLEHEIAEAEEQRLNGESLRTTLDAEFATQQQVLAARRSQIDALRHDVTNLKVRAASLVEKKEAALRATARIETLLADIESRRMGQEQLAVTASHEREVLEASLAEGSVAMAGLVRLHQEAEKAAVGAVEHHAAALAAVTDRSEQLKRLRTQLEEGRHELSRASMRLSELAIKTAHLESALLEKYRLTIPELLLQLGDSGASEADEAQRALVQGQIDELGEVNLTAIEQYRELEERHEFLSTQKVDLEDSLRSLQQAIQRINRTTRKRFMETFTLVNEKFKEVFPRLFCGGCAELRLTNEEDLLESGIEIVVQPPGKKLQNVSLLSGGEKALTAVALIFSIFLIKPSPFCLLDEVDAPLDDANIGRFNEMIREMTSFSQFILITHSKTTMAVADTLYGVTMEEPGVSKLVSVKLN
jgi:chromosome segregation protein